MEEQQRGGSTIESEGTTLLAHHSKRKKYATKEKKTFKDEWKTKKKFENCKKVGDTTEDCIFTKGFPASHPLHGVSLGQIVKSFKKI